MNEMIKWFDSMMMMLQEYWIQMWTRIHPALLMNGYGSFMFCYHPVFMAIHCKYYYYYDDDDVDDNNKIKLLLLLSGTKKKYIQHQVVGVYTTSTCCWPGKYCINK